MSGPSSRVVHAFVKNPLAVSGLALFGLTLVVAILAPALAPDSYDNQDIMGRLKPPLSRGADGRVFLLGSDPLGRDMLSRIIYGARASVSVALAGLVIGGGLGSLLGLLAGFGGRGVDALVMRLVDAQLAFPSLLLAIAVIAALGTNLWTLLAVLALRSWAVHARTLRAAVLVIREQESVTAARALGAGPMRVAFKEVLPNAVAPLIVVATAQLGALILLESTLSFLGIGLQPPAPSWGSMLSSGRPYMTVAWWVAAVPGVAILIAVLGANLLGDGLRDALDPRLKWS
jgi:ABC-type dipeptide/oligopeptide/nickel transport system permease subunit